MLKKKEVLLYLFFIFFFKTQAQDLVAINDSASPESSYELEQLIKEVLITGGCAEVSNFSSQSGGAATDLTTKSYGYFSKGSTVGFPFESGIVLTTGKAYDGGNTYIPNPPIPRVFPDNNIGVAGDTDIENVLGIANTKDATFIKFNFVPALDTISFNFLMASEEYDRKTECDYTDGFAFLMREVGATNYTNIALLPNGTPVSVKTINNAPDCAANTDFFAGYEIRDTNYGGRTVVLNATSTVTPGTTYEIKLVVSDQGDANKDSAIFIEEGSLNLGGDLGRDITIANGNAVCIGQSVTLNTQTPNANHTWYLNGVEIPGAGSGQTITVTEAGTYSVDISFAANCTVNDSIIVEFKPYEDASFTITPGCDGGTAIITGDTGGVFSFNPAPTDGATIDQATGTVTNGVVGASYTVEYVTPGSCSDTKSSTFTVTSSSSGNATFTATATCDGGTATITGDTGGVFTFYPVPTDGALIDAATGTVTAGVAGRTYTIKYTTPGTCGASTAQDITVLSSDNASFSITATCNGGVALITGDPGGIFAFDPVPTDGAVIDAVTGTVTQGVTGTTYTIKYTTSGTCSATTSQNVTVSPSGNALFTAIATCDGGIATITGEIGGTFSFDPAPIDDAVIDAVTGTVTDGTPNTTYTIRYTTIGDCESYTNQDITVLPEEDSSFTMLAKCYGGLATITGDTGGVFAFNPIPNDGAIVDSEFGFVIGNAGVTYTVSYTTNGPCPSTSTQSVTVLEPEDPSFVIEPNCDGATVTITGDAGGMFTFNPLPNDGAVINSSTGTITNATSGATYTVEYITSSGICAKSLVKEVTVYEVPIAVEPEPLISCEEDTLGNAVSLFDLESKSDEISNTNTNYVITYYETINDANQGINPLTSPYTSTSKRIFVRVNNELGLCFVTTELDLQVEQTPTITSTVYELCDDNVEFDGDTTNDSVSFDLESQTAILLNGQDPTLNTVSYYENLADAEAQINALNSIYDNRINPQTLTVRVDNNNTECFVIGELTLKVNSLPSFDLKDNYTLCIDKDGSEIITPPIIDTGLNTTDYIFEWYKDGVLIDGAVNGSYSPIQPGSYNVIATNALTGCANTSIDPNTITMVKESTRPLLSANQVSVAFHEENNILATATHASPLSGANTYYEFSLNGGPWVSSNPNEGNYIFEDVGAGEHIVEARDINGCGIASVAVVIIDYPLYFTPNGDGYHDTWNIIDLNNELNAVIYIFDRYGKLLKQINSSGVGWDGTYKNRLMPSNDYWFKLEYKKPNTNEKNEFKAHFTLKR